MNRGTASTRRLLSDGPIGRGYRRTIWRSDTGKKYIVHLLSHTNALFRRILLTKCVYFQLIRSIELIRRDQYLMLMGAKTSFSNSTTAILCKTKTKKITIYPSPCICVLLFYLFTENWIRKLLKEESAQLLHPLDKALVDDPTFRSYVEQYAKVLLNLAVFGEKQLFHVI